MIKVKELGNNQYEISWNENDPQESFLNTLTEQDIIDAIKEHLEKINKT
jgi:hypothetical protein